MELSSRPTFRFYSTLLWLTMDSLTFFQSYDVPCVIELRGFPTISILVLLA